MSRIVDQYDATRDRTRSYDLESPQDIARYLIRNPYTFPGGYELYLITDDGGIICGDCIKSEYRLIYTSFKGDGWHPAGITGDHEMDENCYCDHCNREIGPDCLGED